MLILAIDTSCDETAVAITSGRQVLSHVEYTQIQIHTAWGGVVPSLAKRAHEERIDYVIEKALKKARKQITDIDYIAVTYGPGLAIALEVGILKAQEIARKYNKPIIPVNHMEGHIYSSFVQNSKGNPNFEFAFPYIGVLVSGGHTELILWKDHLSYEIIGETVDDAAGEALDKAGKMLKLGYPGGPVLERLAEKAGNSDYYKFPRPMLRSQDLNFSFSGLKTAFLYCIKKMNEDEIVESMDNLSSSFQEAVFATLIKKLELAIKQYKIVRLVTGGGVVINKRFRYLIRHLVQKYDGTVLFPSFKYLTSDNASMIGVAAYYKLQKNIIVRSTDQLQRVPRLSLENPYIID